MVRATRDSTRQWQRVKPDPETNPLADLDCAKVPTAAARGRRFPSPRGGVALASHQRTNRVSGSPLPEGDVAERPLLGDPLPILRVLQIDAPLA